MTKILIQNAFNDYDNDGYFLACRPNGKIQSGDFIILKKNNMRIKIIKVENVNTNNVLITVQKMPIGSLNISKLYNKEFDIEKKEI